MSHLTLRASSPPSRLAFIAYRLRSQGRRGRGRSAPGATRRRPAVPSLRRGGDRPPRFGVVGLVAAREVRQRVRGRVFRVATLLMLAGVAAAIVIPAANKSNAHTAQVGVVGAPRRPS